MAGLYEEKLSDTERTAKALALLREARDAKQASEPASPEPRERDWAFQPAEDGRARLADAPISNDEEQAELQEDLYRNARDLSVALAGSNEFGAIAEGSASERLTILSGPL